MLLIPLLTGITLFAFSLLRTLPGDIAVGLVGERASREAVENIRREIGTDRGFIMQYAGYLRLLAQGDFGRSYYTNRDVLADIVAKFPNTVKLAIAAMFISVPCGIVFGLTAAYSKGRFTGRLLDSISIAGLSVPVFWSAIIVMMLFSLELKLFPPSGTGGIKFIVLPAFVLAVPACATLTRITKITVIDILRAPHISTARAKGLHPMRIGAIHVLKNALIPVITIIGLDFGSYLNGAVVTETIFGWDGMGRFAMEGITRRDYPVIMGCLIAGTVIFVLVNLITDLLYHYIDPRIRFGDNVGR